MKYSRTPASDKSADLPHGSDPRTGPGLPVLLGVLLILWTAFLVAMAYLQHSGR